MNSIIIQTISKNNFIPGSSSSQLLLFSQPNDGSQPPQPALCRRRSSASLRIHQQLPSPGAPWSTNSISSMGYYAGGSIRKWWERGWSWIMSRKPVFAQDHEMNVEEGRVLGEKNKGSLRHVLFKVRSEIMKLGRI